MEKVKPFLVLALVFILFGCKPAPDPELLDDFRGEINAETVDYGSSDNSEIEVSGSEDNKFCGDQSLRLSYQLNCGGYMWAGRGYKLDIEGAAAWLVEPNDIDWRRYNAVRLAMYGQNSGAIYAFDLKDKGGEVWRFLIDDDFEGWQKIILPFDNFFSRRDWQPDEAEVTQSLDFPIFSYQFEPIVPGERVVYFDCVTLIRR